MTLHIKIISSIFSSATLSSVVIFGTDKVFTLTLIHWQLNGCRIQLESEQFSWLFVVEFYEFFRCRRRFTLLQSEFRLPFFCAHFLPFLRIDLPLCATQFPWLVCLNVRQFRLFALHFPIIYCYGVYDNSNGYFNYVLFRPIFRTVKIILIFNDV